MKTNISSAEGVVTSNDGDGFTIGGIDHREAAFTGSWDDLTAVIHEGTGPAALTYEGYRGSGFFMRFFRHNQDDSIFMVYQMPHSWDTTTSVKPHAHVIPMSAGSGTVKFNFVYAWTLVNTGTLPSDDGWTSGSVTSSFTAAHQYQQRIISFGSVSPPSGSHASVIFVMKAERPGLSDSVDTYSTSKDHGTAAANLGILSFDLHYQKSRAGTLTQFPEG